MTGQDSTIVLEIITMCQEQMIPKYALLELGTMKNTEFEDKKWSLIIYTYLF